MFRLKVPIYPSLFLLLFLLRSVSPANLCSTSGQCCKHRDSHCVSQKINANHTVDTSDLPCYCDHACVHLDDCCPDYKQFCGVSDCRVSEWGPWSPCSSRCGIGFQERRRIILHQPNNGGAKCPHLMQSKQCRGLACYEDDRDETDESLKSVTDSRTTETNRLKDGEDTTSSDQTDDSASNDDFESTTSTLAPTHDIMSLAKSNIKQSCMEMVIIKASKGCQHHDHRLHIGTRICVQCPDEGSGFQPEDPDSDDVPTCSELTEAPIRRFRIEGHCHGKLTFLAKNANQNCSCSKGLHYELTH